MALPSNVAFGTVTGTFIRGVGDSPADVDRDPDAQPVSDLSITFTPSIAPAIVRDASTSPPVTMLIAPVACTADSSGTLLGPDGQAGVRLIASTNTSLNPTAWTWTVSIQSATFPLVQFSFLLDPNTSIDLATVTPVAASTGRAPVGNSGGNSGGGTTTPGTVTATDNGDGTVTYTGSGVTDNGDGTFALSGSNVTDNGDGTFTVT